jgi:hypothetical protein
MAIGAGAILNVFLTPEATGARNPPDAGAFTKDRVARSNTTGCGPRPPAKPAPGVAVRASTGAVVLTKLPGACAITIVE